MKWSEIFLRYLEKNFEIFRKKILNFRKHIRRFFVIFVSRPRSALKRFIKICVRRPSVRSEQIKIFIETFLECSSRYTLKELSLFIAVLKTTSKLITFSQRSIKLLVGILFDFFTPAKLTEIQRRISPATSHWSLPLCLNTVKPLLSRHLRDLPNCPLSRGCPLDRGL